MSLQNERHIQISNPEPLIDLEPASERSGAGEPIVLHPEVKRAGEAVFPLGMVLDACPDIVDYSRGGISNWRDLVAAACVVRAALGVSPSAWEEAQTILGEKSAAIVIAAILQRGDCDHQRRRLPAGTHSQVPGERVLDRPYAHGAHLRAPKKARVGCSSASRRWGFQRRHSEVNGALQTEA